MSDHRNSSATENPQDLDTRTMHLGVDQPLFLGVRGSAEYRFPRSN